MAVRGFGEFLKANIVKKQARDRSRAGYLAEESAGSYKYLLEKIDKLTVRDDNANDFIKSCHDILLELIRAKMLIDGYNASGFGAHEAEVSYMRVIGFDENDVQFANQMRFFRNGMIYYGTRLDKAYAEKVVQFTKRVYPKLKAMVG